MKDKEQNGLEELLNVEELRNIKKEDEDMMFVDRTAIGMSLISDDRIKASVGRLEKYDFLKDYTIEIYKKEREEGIKSVNKIRLKAIGNISDNDKELLTGKSTEEGNEFYNVLNSENKFYKDIEHLFLKSRVSLMKFPINDFGWLVINSKNNKDLDEYTMNFLKTYTKIITGAIKHALDYEKNYEASITDALTGLYNYKHFKNSLGEEIERELRKPVHGLSLMLLDLDNFKNYNDAHGHNRGDNVLKDVAHILRAGARRKTDFVARSGIGDEFAILMPDSDIEYAFECASGIKNNIKNHQFSGEEKSGKISASIGIAHCPTHALNEEYFYKVADQALYYSKKNGKGIITIYNQSITF